METFSITTCYYCGVSSNMYCAACRIICYCSKACQVKHWLLHRDNCITPGRLSSLIDQIDSRCIGGLQLANECELLIQLSQPIKEYCNDYAPVYIHYIPSNEYPAYINTLFPNHTSLPLQQHKDRIHIIFAEGGRNIIIDTTIPLNPKRENQPTHKPAGRPITIQSHFDTLFIKIN